MGPLIMELQWVPGFAVSLIYPANHFPSLSAYALCVWTHTKGIIPLMLKVQRSRPRFVSSTRTMNLVFKGALARTSALFHCFLSRGSSVPSLCESSLCCVMH